MVLCPSLMVKIYRNEALGTVVGTEARVAMSSVWSSVDCVALMMARLHICRMLVLVESRKELRTAVAARTFKNCFLVLA